MFTLYKETNKASLGMAISPYFSEMLGFDPEEWLDKPDNIAVTDGEDDYGLFELGLDEVYTGHYFFVRRGKAAKILAREMLEFFFNTTNAKAVRGLTPLGKIGARWMSRQLGFKSYGVIQTIAGPCELFILTRKEWEGN